MITHFAMALLLGLFTGYIGLGFHDANFWVIIITGNIIFGIARIVWEWK